MTDPTGGGLEEAVARLRASGAYLRACDAAASGVRDLEASGRSGTEEHARALLLLGRQLNDAGHYGAARRNLDHAATVAQRLGGGEGLAAVALAVRAGIDRSLTRLDDAETAMARASILAPQSLPPDDPWSIEVLAEGAMLLITRGDLEQAETLLGRAVRDTEAMPSGNGRDGCLSLVLAAAGTLERVRGRYVEAEDLLRRALACSESAFGPASLEVAGALNNLGVNAKFRGRFDQGEVVYRRALAILEAAFGESHPDVAALYHNLGGLAHARRDFVAAEPFARRSVEIRERTLGPDDPLTALDRAALAAILDRLGRSEEAEAMLRDAVAILVRTLGTDHHEVAAQLNNLAAILQRRGALDDAEALYREALAIKERVLGRRSPELATTLNNLGTLLRVRGNDLEAQRMYGRALDLLEGSVEPTHPGLATTRRNIAKLEALLQEARKEPEP